jgi:hypothetical protein
MSRPSTERPITKLLALAGGITAATRVTGATVGWKKTVGSSGGGAVAGVVGDNTFVGEATTRGVCVGRRVRSGCGDGEGEGVLVSSPPKVVWQAALVRSMIVART